MAYTPAAIGNGSMVTNGQIVSVPMLGQFFPNLAQAPIYKGSGQPPPTIPINYMNNLGNSVTSGSDIAAANPWSLTQSPLPILIVAMVIGYFLLRYVHFA